MEEIMWIGTEQSLDSYRRFREFIEQPANAMLEGDAPKPMIWYGDDDDDDAIGGMDELGESIITRDGNVGIVNIRGGLVDGHSFWNAIFGLVSYQEIRGALQILADDDSVNTIVMNISSPGGMFSGIDETSRFIERVKQTKPIHAHTSTGALSGGYWLAAAANRITASRTAQVGSIGVIMVHSSYFRYFKDKGVDHTVFRAGSNKALGHPYEKFSDKAAKVIQENMEKTYGFFVEHVSKHRPVSGVNKANWADGSVFFADEAKAKNLIDDVKYFDFVVETLRNKQNNQLVSDSSGLDKEVDAMASKKVSSEQDLAKLQSGAEVQVEETEVEVNDNTDNNGVDIDDSVNSDTEVNNDDGADTQVSAEDADPSSVSQEEEVTDKDVGGQSVEATLLKDAQAQVVETSTKLALAEAKLEEAQSKLDAAEKDLSGLTAIAVEATNRLQIALGKSPTSLAGLPASSVMEQYQAADSQFKEAFGVKPAAKAVKADRDVQDGHKRPNIYPV